MTTDKLRELIAKAEEEHIANGFVVEIAEDNLNNARQKASISRRKVMALRNLLIQAEKEIDKTICAKCGQRYGVHDHLNGYCPEGDWYHPANTFAEKKEVAQ